MMSILLRKMRLLSLKKKGEKNWRLCVMKLIFLLRSFSSVMQSRKVIYFH
uniref:Uncharacterized protein n=1 Tax=Rhizophora mucronata TaxID=61149 RepID=A0A2P2L6W2_RHIMU